MECLVHNVLVLAVIKEAMDAFEAGDENAAVTLAKIVEACRQAKQSIIPLKWDAA